MITTISMVWLVLVALRWSMGLRDTYPTSATSMLFVSCRMSRSSARVHHVMGARRDAWTVAAQTWVDDQAAAASSQVEAQFKAASDEVFTRRQKEASDGGA